MAIRDLTSQRLFVETDLHEAAAIDCDATQANYLVNVLRLKVGETVLVFNGRDGEWAAEVAETAKRKCRLIVRTICRAQEAGPDMLYVFALLKRTRLETIVQKATELGAAQLQPVTTDHSQVDRVNPQRLRANVIEAAEQCGILRVPDIHSVMRLDHVLDQWEPQRPLVFCDEGAEITNPIAALGAVPPGPVAVLIGPEGGFSPRERSRLLGMASVVRLSLGPRIMRADTAGIAALALVNVTVGDWR